MPPSEGIMIGRYFVALLTTPEICPSAVYVINAPNKKDTYESTTPVIQFEYNWEGTRPLRHPSIGSGFV
ncbi:unnamed protein product [Taenia asiatica]|uniref:UBC core domain-containing protein n=1 Tax=Taenia asiatica TaxID=60517 RepID=A0A0R3W5P2_TAEAS|nr:unnamed protein product [Taenia asiatica]